MRINNMPPNAGSAMKTLSLFQLLLLDLIAGITHGSSLNQFEPYSYYEIDHSIMQNDHRDQLAIYLLDISQVGGNILGSLLVVLLQFTTAASRESVLSIASMCCVLLSALQIIVHQICQRYQVFVLINTLQGVSTSFLVIYVPVWLSEIACSYKKHRGYLLIVFQLAITIGIFLNVITCSFMPMPGKHTAGGLFGFYFQLVLFFAFSILFSFQIIALRNSLRVSPVVQHSVRFDDLLDATHKNPLILALSIGLLQQFSGLNSMLFSKDIMQDTSWYDKLIDNTQFGHQLVNSMLNLIAIVYAIPFIEKYGRRTLLKFGEAALIVAQVGVFIANEIYNLNCYNGAFSADRCSVTATAFQTFVTLLTFSFEISSGPLYYVIVGEYFPEQLRVLLSAVALGVNQSANLFNQALYTIFDDNQYLHLLNAVTSAVLLLIVLRVMPETKGMSLDEIQDCWREFETCRKVRI